jgi:hypothetical protein
MVRTHSRVLTLPADNPVRIGQLTAKLEEYRRRFDPHKAPELQMHLLMKTILLDTLLQHGAVETGPLSDRLAAQFGVAFNLRVFADACAVIADYCTTGGERVRGGTGLPSPSILSPTP